MNVIYVNRLDGLIEDQYGRIIGGVPFFILLGTTCIPGKLLLLSKEGFIISILLSSLDCMNGNHSSDTDFIIVGRIEQQNVLKIPQLEFARDCNGFVSLMERSSGESLLRIPVDLIDKECDLELLIHAIESAQTRIAELRVSQSTLIDGLKAVAPLNRLATDTHFASFVNWQMRYESPASDPRLNVDLCFIRLTLDGRSSLSFMPTLLKNIQLIAIRAHVNENIRKEFCFNWPVSQAKKLIVDFPAKEPLLSGPFVMHLWLKASSCSSLNADKTVLIDSRRFDVLDFIKPPPTDSKAESHLSGAVYFNECGLAENRLPQFDETAIRRKDTSMQLSLRADDADNFEQAALQHSYRKLLPVLLGDGVEPLQLRQIVTSAQTAVFICPFNDHVPVECELSSELFADRNCLQIRLIVRHPSCWTREAVEEALNYRLRLLGASLLNDSTSTTTFELLTSQLPDYH